MLTLLTEYDVQASEVSVLITSDDELQRLNRSFRNLDETTDVLSFPAPHAVSGQLGDIAISIEFAEAGALQRGVDCECEIAMLAIHGGMHLLGFDDSTDEERADMLARMNEIANKVGLPTDSEWSSLPHGGSA